MSLVSGTVYLFYVLCYSDRETNITNAWVGIISNKIDTPKLMLQPWVV